MGLEKIVRTVSGRLSLREPQTVSLERLHNALESMPALRDPNARSADELKAMQEALRLKFPKLTDFERDFPSLCFALATGVGKTRLMGAFISYLHAAYGYKHFFVLAPNLTIYDKLIRDFSDTTGPKYVFKGIADFAVEAPEVITGETYEQKGDLVSQAQYGHDSAPVQINIFNISKINSEVRGGKAPKIKRLSEYLGQSYFEYLAGLPDLVLIMDESHRYRASAGIRALNELKPLLGLELTATPFTEGKSGGNSGPVPFRNVVMDYPLALAIEDGFVKEPAVVTQQNFNPADHSAEQLERIKLMDGIRVHEETKVHLLTYAEQTGQKPVKPFMLVIARDTTHATALLGTIEGLFDGQYKGKVIQVDSSKTGAEEEEMIRRLLLVESYTEPTEIVIHVNMLKEGWDVTNLYTIVPLRAANARTLIEQSIGRGLRLPYGRRTGVEVVDRLNIIAHDRFKEVIDEAGKGDSPIRLKELKLEPTDNNGNRLTSLSVPSNTGVILGISEVKGSGTGGAEVVSTGYGQGAQTPSVVFTGEERRIAMVAMDAVAELGKDRILVPTSAALGAASVQERLTQLVMERLVPQQGELLEAVASNAEAVAEVVKKSVAVFIDQTIDIPRITVVPIGPIKGGYRSFALDVSRMNYQATDQQLLSQGLQSGRQLTYGEAAVIEESRFEDYIVRELINYDDVSYDDHADLIYELAGQAVAHFRSKQSDAAAVHNILGNHGRAIAENIHLQMAKHYEEDSTGSEVIVSQGFMPLKPCAFTAKDDVKPLHWTPDDKRTIGQYVYGGFQRCAFAFQKFHSDTERILATVLEREARRWFRPASGQFNIYYRSGVNQPEYIPDFVVALDDITLMIETKKAKEVVEAQESETEVKAKADQAVIWCRNASDYAAKVGGKPWAYLLVPHDAVAQNMTLAALRVRYEVK